MATAVASAQNELSQELLLLTPDERNAAFTHLLQSSSEKCRTDFNAGELRLLAKRAEGAGQARRLLSLAAVLDGMSREAAAEIGAMDRQTLRDWVHASTPRVLRD